jgi:Pyruvate/2-oxoacid:ferredoxin oxidoreductase delta subunit
MLVCLDLYIRPRLYIVDGIIAMQGNGPRGGDPVNMNVLLFSKDPVALEAVICRLIDLNPEFVPTMIPAQEWGLGTYHFEDIEMLGDPIEPLINKSFNVVRAPVSPVTSSTTVSFIKNLVSPRPVINVELCNHCGTCVKVCPAQPKAVDWHDGDHKKAPTYKYERCIRCFCCQELCPEHAISVKTPWLGQIVRPH